MRGWCRCRWGWGGVDSYRHTVPTHQGRGAEHLISKLLIKPGDYVPGNMYFTTTRLHQELAGGHFVDVIVDAAHDPQDQSPFKGNVDIAKLDALVARVGAERIPYVSLATAVNMAGGQPVSMANVRALRTWCDHHGVKLVHDMTRVAENAYFIQQREPGYADKHVRDIVHELCALTDIATMSAKKDALVNIGGFLAMNDDDLYRRACDLVVVYEGLHTYGGLAGRDMEAMAIGIRESVDDNHIRARVGQVEHSAQPPDSTRASILIRDSNHLCDCATRRVQQRIDLSKARHEGQPTAEIVTGASDGGATNFAQLRQLVVGHLPRVHDQADSSAVVVAEALCRRGIGDPSAAVQHGRRLPDHDPSPTRRQPRRLGSGGGVEHGPLVHVDIREDHRVTPCQFAGGQVAGCQ